MLKSKFILILVVFGFLLAAGAVLLWQNSILTIFTPAPSRSEVIIPPQPPSEPQGTFVVQPEVRPPSPDEKIIMNPGIVIKDFFSIDDWKTYQNEKYIFEMKYPKEWNMAEKELTQEERRANSPEEIYFFPSGTTAKKAPIILAIYPNPSEVSVGEWLQDKNEGPQFQQIKLDYFEVFGTLQSQEGMKKIYRPHNKTILVFSYTGEGGNEFAKIFYTMVYNLKFGFFMISRKETEITDFLPVTDWKTYRSEKHGFEVKYPMEWYVIETDYGVTFSTTPTGSAYDFDEKGNIISYDVPWGRITLTIEKKLGGETLEQWLARIGAVSAPGVDTMLQYVKIGDKKFFGTLDFEEVSWKNTYFNMLNDKVLRLSFQHKAPDSFLTYSKIFYSMISTLQLP